jgi:hypothetical protein
MSGKVGPIGQAEAADFFDKLEVSGWKRRAGEDKNRRKGQLKNRKENVKNRE